MKRVLFLNQGFYNYDFEIQSNIEAMGYKLYSYGLFPHVGALWKILGYGVSKRLEELKRTQQIIIDDIKNKKLQIDVVFVLAGNDLLESTVSTLRELYPNAVYIWYMWDGTENIQYFIQNREYFDTIISFDIIESQKMGLDYLPLFYIHRISDSCVQDGTKYSLPYDISIIGSNHGDRYDIVRHVIDSNKYQEVYAYLCSGKIVYLKSLLRNGKRALDVIGTKPLTYDKAIRIMMNSRCILDIQSEKQTGLTMRTIESLGLKKKIITTNNTIKLYDFYSSQNEYVIDRSAMDLPDRDFLLSDYEEIDEDVYNSYHISNWCRKIIEHFEYK